MIYAITDQSKFSLAAGAAAGLAAALGLTLAVRWIAACQAGPPRAPARAVPVRAAGTESGDARTRSPGPVFSQRDDYDA